MAAGKSVKEIFRNTGNNRQDEIKRIKNIIESESKIKGFS